MSRPACGQAARPQCSLRESDGESVPTANRSAESFHTYSGSTALSNFEIGSSKWDLKTASINGPVMVGTVQVNPGDIMFADETGIVVIPAAKKAVVLLKANEIREAEDGRRTQIP